MCRARSRANERFSAGIVHEPDQGDSSIVTSNQRFVHRQLIAVVSKHLNNPYQRPIAPYSHTLFKRLNQIIDTHGGPLILDSGCGNGEGARALAQQFPTHLILGIDKSRMRIARADMENPLQNLYIVRGDCVDLWRLAGKANWPIDQHYLFYPNPWPKAKHLQRRWHGHPVFAALIALGGQLELRSNWEIYIEEFASALEVAGVSGAEIERLRPSMITTSFERKYFASGHNLFKLRIQLP